MISRIAARLPDKIKVVLLIGVGMLWMPIAAISLIVIGSVLAFTALSAIGHWQDGRYVSSALTFGAFLGLCWAFNRLFVWLNKRGHYQEPRMDF